MTLRSAIRLGLSLALLFLFLLHSTGAMPVRLLTQIEAYTYDARVRLTLPAAGTPHIARVVILDMDEKTLAAEGWPLPRDRLAQMVTLLFERYRIRTLGMDILFADPDRSSGAALLTRLAQRDMADLPGFAVRAEALQGELDYDRRFAEALRGRSVVLGYFFKPVVPFREAPTSGALCAPLIDREGSAPFDIDFLAAQGFGGNLPLLQQAAPLCGFFDNPALDADGVFRRVPLVQKYEGALYPSLALALTRAALGMPPVSFEFSPPDQRSSLNLEALRIGDLRVAVDGEMAAHVPYRGRYGAFPYVSVTDVLHERADAEALKDAIVLLGTSAAGLLDLRTTPVGSNYAGVEVHANLVSGMLEGRVKRKAPYHDAIEFIVLLSIALLLTVLIPRLSPLAAAGLLAGVVAALIALAMAMWTGANFIMPMGVPLVFALSLFVAQLLYGRFVESRGRRDAMRLFAVHLPPQRMDELAARRGAASMVASNRDMSVLFADVRGFASVAEQFRERPQELSQLMSEYLGALTGAIHQHRGTLDKYMGGAVMAFWGAPLDDPQHATHALLAALEMNRALRGLDEAFERRGWPTLQVSIGINSGDMRVGDMGSPFRAAYTVLGDSVKLAARVEQLSNVYGASLLCTEFTRRAAPADWAFREIDLVRLPGREQAIAVFEPLGPKDQLDPALREDLARHRGALQACRAQQWDKAEAELSRLRASAHPHAIYGLFIDRIRELRRNPPAADWDGALDLDPQGRRPSASRVDQEDGIIEK